MGFGILELAAYPCAWHLASLNLTFISKNVIVSSFRVVVKLVQSYK